MLAAPLPACCASCGVLSHHSDSVPAAARLSSITVSKLPPQNRGAIIVNLWLQGTLGYGSCIDDIPVRGNPITCGNLDAKGPGLRGDGTAWLLYRGYC